jgi:NADPH2:quinone reductase
MQAVRMHRFGGPEVYQLEEVEDPHPGPGEVRVRVEAAGVNPVDRLIRQGSFGTPPLPLIPGTDAAGVVDEVGPEVQELSPGQRVYVSGAPAYAQYTVAPATRVWPLPPSLTFDQGAAIGVPYVTAYRALFLVGKVKPGDWCLVRGASGGVGTAAVQLALAAGAFVVGTSSTPQGRDYILALGAQGAVEHAQVEEALGYTQGQGFAVVLEMDATQGLELAVRAAAPGGRVVVVGQHGPTTLSPLTVMRGVWVTGVAGPTLTAQDRLRIHRALAPLLASGLLRPVVDTIYPLAQAAQAQERLAQGGVRGKVVLHPWP